MTTRRSPRPPDLPADPTAPLSSTFAPPHELSEDAVLTLADEITTLLGSAGWRWLVTFAHAEFGSKAVRARIHTTIAGGADLATVGAAAQSILGAALAVERLLNEPNEMLMRLRVEQRKHAAIRARAAS